MPKPCNECFGEGWDSCPQCMGVGEVSTCMSCGDTLDVIEGEHGLCENCCFMDNYDDIETYEENEDEE